MEDLEDTQKIYEYALPDIFTPDSGKYSMVMKVTNLWWGEETSEILNLVSQAAKLCRFFTRMYSTD